jgi:hypothetical protein
MSTYKYPVETAAKPFASPLTSSLPGGPPAAQPLAGCRPAEKEFAPSHAGKQKAAPAEAAFYGTRYKKLLLFFDRFGRADLYAGATLNAFVLVDLILVADFVDRIFGTLFRTGTTGNTFIIDYVHAFLHF